MLEDVVNAWIELADYMDNSNAENLPEHPTLEKLFLVSLDIHVYSLLMHGVERLERSSGSAGNRKRRILPVGDIHSTMTLMERWLGWSDGRWNRYIESTS